MAERSVLVTGCSSGIGLGVAQRFLALGWEVIAGLRDPGRAPAGLQRARCVALDLSQPAQVARAAAGIGRLDCLVNNAGYALAGPFSTYTAEQMERQLRVNLIGPALLTQLVLPALRAARGRVINVSSMAGEAGMPMMSMYCAAKHALEGWSESLRHELAGQGVQVALVEPGGFRTRFGHNMEWGERPLAPQSAEEEQLRGYRAMRERLLARPGKSPQPVVDAIVRLALMDRMPLRTRVGGDAKMLRLLRRWLPESIALGLLGSAFRRHMAAADKP